MSEKVISPFKVSTGDGDQDVPSPVTPSPVGDQDPAGTLPNDELGENKKNEKIR